MPSHDLPGACTLTRHPMRPPTTKHGMMIMTFTGTHLHAGHDLRPLGHHRVAHALHLVGAGIQQDRILPHQLCALLGLQAGRQGEQGRRNVGGSLRGGWGSTCVRQLGKCSARSLAAEHTIGLVSHQSTLLAA